MGIYTTEKAEVYFNYHSRYGNYYKIEMLRDLKVAQTPTHTQ